MLEIGIGCTKIKITWERNKILEAHGGGGNREKIFSKRFILAKELVHERTGEVT